MRIKIQEELPSDVQLKLQERDFRRISMEQYQHLSRLRDDIYKHGLDDGHRTEIKQALQQIESLESFTDDYVKENILKYNCEDEAITTLKIAMESVNWKLVFKIVILVGAIMTLIHVLYRKASDSSNTASAVAKNLAESLKSTTATMTKLAQLDYLQSREIRELGRYLAVYKGEQPILWLADNIDQEVLKGYTHAVHAIITNDTNEFKGQSDKITNTFDKLGTQINALLDDYQEFVDFLKRGSLNDLTVDNIEKNYLSRAENTKNQFKDQLGLHHDVIELNALLNYNGPAHVVKLNQLAENLKDLDTDEKVLKRFNAIFPIGIDKSVKSNNDTLNNIDKTFKELSGYKLDEKEGISDEVKALVNKVMKTFNEPIKEYVDSARGVLTGYLKTMSNLIRFCNRMHNVNTRVHNWLQDILGEYEHWIKDDTGDVSEETKKNMNERIAEIVAAGIKGKD